MSPSQNLLIQSLDLDKSRKNGIGNNLQERAKLKNRSP